MRLTALLLAVFMSPACAEQATEGPSSRWTQFVHVDGQPEPIPAQWVTTPEGKFAHSVKIPNPVPRDSGYRSDMTSDEYFRHLCEAEAGEFIFKIVESVAGFYFVRPPARPKDDDLKDRYKVEAPELERLFQLMRNAPTERAQLFVNPPWRLYRFVEEPSPDKNYYIRSYGYRQDKSPMNNAKVKELHSKFGLIWRGIRRPMDRELSIAGGEWIVFGLESKEVLAVARMYGLSPKARSTPQGVWWLNASQCPGAKTGRTAADNSPQLYQFVSKVLRPARDNDK